MCCCPDSRTGLGLCSSVSDEEEDHCSTSVFYDTWKWLKIFSTFGLKGSNAISLPWLKCAWTEKWQYITHQYLFTINNVKWKENHCTLILLLHSYDEDWSCAPMSASHCSSIHLWTCLPCLGTVMKGVLFYTHYSGSDSGSGIIWQSSLECPLTAANANEIK